ncbi:MAG: DNA internalization-related competence protein ComEC/Rec2 [Gemmatimonadales bacterium]
MWRSGQGDSAGWGYGRGALLLAAGYGAGLLTGLARFPDPIVVTLVLVLVVRAAGELAWPVAVGMAIGILAGTAAVGAARASCAARLHPGVAQYRLHLVDPGSGTGRVVVLGTACTGTVVVRWPSHPQVGAGHDVTAIGEWNSRPGPFGKPGGTLNVTRIESVRGTPGVLARLRNAVAGGSAALYGPRAPVVDALIAGWRGRLDAATRSDFAASGMTYLLAISGFHVACLAGWLIVLLRAVRFRRHASEFIAAGAALGYTVFLGVPAPALRATAMLILLAWSQWRQRRVRTTAMVAAAALVVMVADPWSVASAGAWMSVAGVAGVFAAIRWSDRTLSRAWLVRSISASVGALVTTAPIAAAVLGRVAPVSVPLSVVAGPLLGMLLPVLVVSLALRHVIAAAAAAFAAAGNGLIAVLQWIVQAGAHAPGAAESAMVSPAGVAMWIAVAVAGAWAISGRATAKEAVRRLAWSGAAVVWISLIPQTGGVRAGQHTLTLVFVNVGQGDGALIETPGGHWVEVDAGPVDNGYDAGLRAMVPELLRRHAARIDLFVLSHAHRDHVGGGVAVMDRIPVVLAVEPGELFSDAAYDSWLGALAAHHVRWHAALAGAHWMIDSVQFRVLHPPTPWPREGEDLNEDSIVLEVSYAGFRALLMGDAGFVAESVLAGTLRPADVLKVGHHGSSTASSDAFLAAVHPRVAVVSVGRYNRYGHPSPETMRRLAHAGAMVLRTDQRGTVTVTTDGRSFTVTTSDTTASFGTAR